MDWANFGSNQVTHHYSSICAVVSFMWRTGTGSWWWSPAAASIILFGSSKKNLFANLSGLKQSILESNGAHKKSFSVAE